MKIVTEFEAEKKALEKCGLASSQISDLLAFVGCQYEEQVALAVKERDPGGADEQKLTVLRDSVFRIDRIPPGPRTFLDNSEFRDADRTLVLRQTEDDGTGEDTCRDRVKRPCDACGDSLQRTA